MSEFTHDSQGNAFYGVYYIALNYALFFGKLSAR